METTLPFIEMIILLNSLICSSDDLFLGDNRDCSKIRFYQGGYVHQDNLFKAQFLFFSSDVRVGSIFSFWNWSDIIRFDRFFKKIK